MKINEVQSVLTTIRGLQLQPEKFSVHFSYALAKNARFLQVEMDTFIESINEGHDMEKLVAWEKARQNLRKLHAEKPPSDGEGASAPPDPDAVEKTINEALETDFPGITEQVEERRKKIVEFEKEDLKVDLFMIPLARVPDLPADVVDRLYPLIQGE